MKAFTKKRNGQFLTVFAVMCIAAIFSLTLLGCGGDSDDDGGGGGGGGDDKKSTVEYVNITTAGDATSVNVGGTLQFSAEVTGTNNPSQDVTWSIDTTGYVAGTGISTSGLLTVAEDETKTYIVVEAVSKADTSKSNTKTITVILPAPTVATFSGTTWKYENSNGFSYYVEFGSDGVISLKADADDADMEVTAKITNVQEPDIENSLVNYYNVTYKGTLTKADVDRDLNTISNGPYSFGVKKEEGGDLVWDSSVIFKVVYAAGTKTFSFPWVSGDGVITGDFSKVE